MPSEVFLTRAEWHFTEAMAIAVAAGEAELEAAVRAGRARIRTALGNWDEAVADAEEIATTYRYEMPYFDTESALYNELWEASAGTFRAHTVWNTYYDAYHAETGDPRVTCFPMSDVERETNPNVPLAS